MKKKPAKDPQQIFVGTFDLGHEEVDLIALTNEGGGYFYFIPERGKRASIKVGLQYKEWLEVVNVLLHESVEFALTRSGHRFVSCAKFNGDSGWFTFIMDHPQFGHAMSCAADFITPALPKLAPLWKKHRKK